jgi:AraC-like DNA-binding protein
MARLNMNAIDWDTHVMPCIASMAASGDKASRLHATSVQDEKDVHIVSDQRLDPRRHDAGVAQALLAYKSSFRDAGGDQVEALMRVGAGQGVGAALYKAPPFEVSVPALSVSRLSVNLTSTVVGAGVQGCRMRDFDARRYAMFLTPAELPMVFRKGVPSRHINIYFRADSFEDHELAAPFEGSEPLLNLAVPGMRGLVNQLVDELQHPAMCNADAADCLARLLLLNLARHLQGARASTRRLSAQALALLRDYVMAHLGQRILVADMARQVRLSPDRFALEFKEQTGQTPHQLVMALRLEHASDLLRGSRLSLAEVAHACGFASQQHLSNVMRKQFGVTPGQYRVSQRPLAPA